MTHSWQFTKLPPMSTLSSYFRKHFCFQVLTCYGLLTGLTACASFNQSFQRSPQSTSPHNESCVEAFTQISVTGSKLQQEILNASLENGEYPPQIAEALTRLKEIEDDNSKATTQYMKRSQDISAALKKAKDSGNFLEVQRLENKRRAAVRVQLRRSQDFEERKLSELKKIATFRSTLNPKQRRLLDDLLEGRAFFSREFMEELSSSKTVFPEGLSIPPVLPMTHKTRLEGEIEMGGSIFPFEERLSGLKENELYNYVITSDGHIALIPMLLREVNDGPYIGNHPALVKTLEEQNGGPVELIAAGEFEIRHGVVFQINNKSGAFRGDEAHLAFASAVLKDRGLEVTEQTRRVDVAKMRENNDFHALRKEEIDEVRSLVPSDLRERYAIAFKSVIEAYPSQKDGAQYSEDVVDLFLDAVDEGRVSQAEMNLFFATFVTGKSIDVALLYMRKNEGLSIESIDERINASLKALETLKTD